MANDPVLIAYVVNRRRNGEGVNYERISSTFSHESRIRLLTIIFDAWPLKPKPIILLELGEDDDRRLLTQAKRQQACLMIMDLRLACRAERRCFEAQRRFVRRQNRHLPCGPSARVIVATDLKPFLLRCVSGS